MKNKVQTISIYRNKRNTNKYIEVKHTRDRHYMFRQYLEWCNGVRNNTIPSFTRMRKSIMTLEMLEDYEYLYTITEREKITSFTLQDSYKKSLDKLIR